MTSHATVYVPSARSALIGIVSDGAVDAGLVRDHGRGVVEHAGRAAGDRDRFAPAQHDLGRGGGEERAVRRRDLQQLGVRGHPAGAPQPADDGQHDGDGGEDRPPPAGSGRDRGIAERSRRAAVARPTRQVAEQS